MFEKTSVCPHRGQEAFLTRGSTSLIQRVDVSRSFFNSVTMTPVTDSLQGASAGMTSVSIPKSMVQSVEHFRAHVATVWIHSIEVFHDARSSPSAANIHITWCCFEWIVRGFSSKTVIIGAREPTSTIN